MENGWALLAEGTGPLPFCSITKIELGGEPLLA
jgi:hypothetical protein